MNSQKLLVLSVLVLTFVALWFLDVGRFLNLDYIIQQKESLQNFVDAHFFASVAIYIVLYIIMVTLSLPGGLIMTLSAGALFGLGAGLAMVVVGSTFGATSALLLSRFVARSWVENRFPSQIKKVNEGIRREGAFYLFALRLLPVIPFFLVNLLMGVTRIRTWTFFWVSAVGMFPATLIFVNAGTELGKIESFDDILSPAVFISFCLLAFFPIIAKQVVNSWRIRRKLKGFAKPKRFDYNLIVIGAGAAGLVTSYIAATIKAKVLLVEKDRMGGDCLNTGCVPSKALLKAAKVAQNVRSSDKYGIQSGDIAVDFSGVRAFVRSAIKKIEPHDSAERYQKLGVECHQGQAKITSPYSVDVDGKSYSARAIVVATGARPMFPEHMGLSTGEYYTSETIWNMESLPTHLLILGGGPIACEMAQAFRRLGSEVTLLLRSSRLLKQEDNDVAHTVMSVLTREGVQIRTEHEITGFGKSEAIRYVDCVAPEGKARIEFNEVLVAYGRKANTEGLGLESLSVEINEDGTIQTDKYLRTTLPTLYACGDVAGPYQFTHMAAHQAWYASINALLGWLKTFKVDYSCVPRVTYLDPEIARVGMNEQEARAQGVDYELYMYDLTELDRAITEDHAEGFVKVLTAKGSAKIIGACAVGHNAGEMLSELALAMRKGLGLDAVLSTTHAYPTMAEGNKYVAGEWKKRTAPRWAIGLLKGVLSWRRGNDK